jgi:hypothetical protein
VPANLDRPQAMTCNWVEPQSATGQLLLADLVKPHLSASATGMFRRVQGPAGFPPVQVPGSKGFAVVNSRFATGSTATTTTIGTRRASQIPRIDEIRALKDGWFEGGGESINGKCLDSLERWCVHIMMLGLPMPRLYPTPEGGVQAEWTIGGNDVSVEFDFPGTSAYWHELDLRTGESLDRELDSQSGEDQTWIVRRLGELRGAV